MKDSIAVINNLLRTRELGQEPDAGVEASTGFPGATGEAPGDEEAIYLFLKSALAQAVVIGHWSTGRIYYATEAAADLLGVRPDLLNGMSTLQFFANPHERLDAMRRLGRGERVVRTELRLRSFDDRDLVVLADLGRIIWRGEPSLILVLNDVTQYKRREDRWKERHEEAAAASRAKSEFLAQMSHELRSPLNAILGFAEIVRDGTLGETGRHRNGEYAGLIHQAGTHLLGLVNDVLDLSKIEAGRMEFDLEPLDLAGLAGECLALMQPAATGREIGLSLKESPPVPEALGDRMRCRQIVINLLSNAIKFTPVGGSVVVELALDDDDHVWLCVTDTGVGMTEGQLQLALTPFGQIRHGQGTESGGTGLGLPIVRSLIEAQNGALDIQSRPGVGTRIAIRLPGVRR